jgi:CHASE3 domain sensor protein
MIFPEIRKIKEEKVKEQVSSRVKNHLNSEIWNEQRKLVEELKKKVEVKKEREIVKALKEREMLYRIVTVIVVTIVTGVIVVVGVIVG